jgi:hypothetical protein
MITALENLASLFQKTDRSAEADMVERQIYVIRGGSR